MRLLHVRFRVRFRTLAHAALALSSLLASACASSTSSRPPATAPTATHAPTATPVPPPVNAYLGVGSSLYALDGRTGARLWTYDATQQPGGGSVQDVHVADDVVFFINDSDHSVDAVDATTGAFRWKVNTSSRFGFTSDSRMIVLAGVLYVANVRGQVPSFTYAIEVQSGNVLWHKDGGGNMVVGDDAVYIASHIHGSDAEPDTDGFINAYNRTDGTLLWQAKGHPYFQMLLPAGVLYVTDDDTLYAFDSKTGAMRWSKKLVAFVRPVVLVGNNLYLVDNQQVTALDVTSQAVLWSFPIALSSLAYGDTALCVSNQGHLFGLNPTTGAQLWSKQDANGYTLFQQMNGVCYAVASANAGSSVTAFDAGTGEAHWTANLPKFFNALTPTPNAVYVLSSPGGNFRGAAVDAFSTADGSHLWQFDANAQFPGSLAVG